MKTTLILINIFLLSFFIIRLICNAIVRAVTFMARAITKESYILSFSISDLMIPSVLITSLYYLLNI